MLQHFKVHPKPLSIIINETKEDTMDEIIFEFDEQRREAIASMLNNALNQPPKHLWKDTGD